MYKIIQALKREHAVCPYGHDQRIAFRRRFWGLLGSRVILNMSCDPWVRPETVKGWQKTIEAAGGVAPGTAFEHPHKTLRRCVEESIKTAVGERPIIWTYHKGDMNRPVHITARQKMSRAEAMKLFDTIRQNEDVVSENKTELIFQPRGKHPSFA